MKVLVVGRTLPSNNKSFGLFEFLQAKALSNYVDTGYLFVENSSLLTNRKWALVDKKVENVNTVGYYFPSKGLPPKLYEIIKFNLFKKSYRLYCEKYFTPDIVHVHFPLLTINNLIIDFLKESGVKIVATEHWSLVQKDKLNSRLNSKLNYLMENIDGHISVNTDMKNIINNKTNTNTKMYVIPNIISEAYFHERLPKRKNFENKDFTYIFIGRLHKGKNIDLLIKAFQSAFEKDSSTKLKIVGSGKEERYLKRLVKKDFINRVSFTGHLPAEEIAEHLMNSEVYISASSFETFGVPFFEAMSLGLPVIASNNLSITEYLNEDNSMLFENSDVDDLKETMIAMKNEYNKFNHDEIKSDIKTRFNSKSICEKIVGVYDEVMKESILKSREEWV